jgi:hypothetical protein
VLLLAGHVLLLASHELFKWSSPARDGALVRQCMRGTKKRGRTRDTVEQRNTTLLVEIDMVSGGRHSRGIIVCGLCRSVVSVGSEAWVLDGGLCVELHSYDDYARVQV